MKIACRSQSRQLLCRVEEGTPAPRTFETKLQANKVRAMSNNQTKLQQQLTNTNYPKQRLISRTQCGSLKRQRKSHLHGDEEGFCFCSGCGGLPSATHKLRCLYTQTTRVNCSANSDVRKTRGGNVRSDFGTSLLLLSGPARPSMGP